MRGAGRIIKLFLGFKPHAIRLFFKLSIPIYVLKTAKYN